MRVDIKTSGFDLTEELRDHTNRRLAFALDWAEYAVGIVSVRLTDINGPRGGKDKRCQIRIPLAGGPDVVIQDTESDLYAAIDLAASRASRTLGRRLCRLRNASIKRGRSLRQGRTPHVHVRHIAPDEADGQGMDMRLKTTSLAWS